MGTKGRAILESLGIKIPKLLTLLNKAFADEWLAYYQYWLGAKVAVGMPKEAVVAELIQHSADELRHAGMVADRIIQLGGEPLLEPKEWYDFTNCGYDKPANPDVRVLLDQNIKGEQCAISVYENIMKFTKDKDPVTYDMALQIMTDEVMHEEDLEAIKKDISIMFGKK
ncbi:MAG: ferritin [Omnitrophica WOR_2 bacterium GWF2_38_59]|nr:MAG: ferritin [Omnitrophica WOR_2 bacterium GWF2_38_59]OGX50836.1 MAG: ferritin [Omnitrophica WOR_2 bacterium RIFOXYA2_FULL_38_17]OGX53384.1 MAG: ferritin [Omnitrophica WOR_2 bacterium RIFOXYA12_FULL_38_10]OGX57173.1 MAG: ferritin [Omnitrophica WOR_2 bacterium RIFOXYC2_FULL_38_12]OGX59076.1 MAG: ferritin [Omnitrophica WOR_2 bacterium RIFOXYB2_FULL_38_16]HBG60523.1 ferritin [Candidatus Omnitrophota bacterium]